MPMIDVYAAPGRFADEHQLAIDLAGAGDLRRRQRFADSLRDCYSQVGGTHRRFMLAWLDWWGEFNAGRKREQHAELI